MQWAAEEPGCLIPARALRLACPCAVCVDEMTGRALLDPEKVPVDVSPSVVSLVGTYAVRIHWSDGHSTGMYTFERLRAFASAEGGGR